MGDSDDDRGEYDRRRRDKFRGERNDYDNRRPPPRGYDHRGRGDRHSNSWERGTKRDYYGRDQGGNRDRRDNFGRSSPPFKKTKREWENDQPWKSGQETMLMSGDKNSTAPSVPVLMSFKDFIIQQEDTIDEMESVRRYQEYKVEFKRTQINDFFVLHKAEEWFEEKYHPVKSIERRNTIRSGLRKRLRLFLDLWDQGYLDDLKVNISNNVVILKLLDRAVVKLEGGSDEDMKALDLPPPKPEPPEEGEEGKTESVPPEEGEMNETNIEEKKQEPKSYSYDADGVDDDDGEPNDPPPPGIEAEDEITPPGVEDDESKPDGDNDDDDETNKEDSDSQKKSESTEYVYDGSQVKRPYSLFMRTVPANVTRADLYGVCKRYPGFLRIAMSDPSSERRYSRRAWASFDHTVNIKDICWNLSNIRVKDMELNPCVNRDVSNRVRPVNGITCSPMTMQLDVNFALKIVKKLDVKHQLYVKESNGHSSQVRNTESADNDDSSDIKEEEEIDLPDANPLILRLPENISEMVTGLEVEDEEDDKKDYPIIVNDELANFLDLILLYLRLVHCIDYYNANEYIHEDEMPMRCGIMHVRAAPLEAASKRDVYEWFTQNSAKLEHILKEDENATDDEAEKFGKKNEDIEVENFIKANTQELAKDKWLCPLSGKKFRGPEFIRKHIIMKHVESVDNVKTEVKFFNNYIYDLKRPCFPDPKTRLNALALTGANTTPMSNNSRPSTLPSSVVANVSAIENRSRTTTPSQPVVFATPRPHTPAAYPTTPQNQPPETYGRMNTFPPKAIRRGSSGGHRGDRRLIKYRDLDAPEESDFF